MPVGAAGIVETDLKAVKALEDESINLYQIKDKLNQSFETLNKSYEGIKDYLGPYQESYNKMKNDFGKFTANLEKKCMGTADKMYKKAEEIRKIIT